jgi:hypothetical protein
MGWNLYKLEYVFENLCLISTKTLCISVAKVSPSEMGKEKDEV